MRYPKFTSSRSHLKPLAALLLATALGGCVGYAGYSSRDYGYSHPDGYYAGYPSTYRTSYSSRPYYSHDYGRYDNTNQNGGGN